MCAWIASEQFAVDEIYLTEQRARQPHFYRAPPQKSNSRTPHFPVNAALEKGVIYYFGWPFCIPSIHYVSLYVLSATYLFET
jgi:hypothetical protein